MSGDALPYLGGLFALGVFHGINPGMGWLFAVALGMQEHRRAGVLRALVPLGLGHVIAVGAVILAAAAAGVVVPLAAIEWVVAAMLVGLGLYKLARSRHPRWGGMRVGLAGLTLWSFLMASAHGAGLMALPLFLGMERLPQHAGGNAGHLAAAGAPALGLAATLVHGAGYLLVTALVALVVFEKLGVGILRKAWINLDLIWAVALIVTGGVTLLL